MDTEEIIYEEPTITQKRKRKPMTEKQLQTARANMEKGRQKRAQNILQKKSYYARSSNLPNQDDSEESEEEIIFEPPKNIEVPKVNKTKEPDPDFMSKLMSDMAFIKEHLGKQEGKGNAPTIVNVQVPQPTQPTESADSLKVKRKILMNFGK